MCFPNNYKSDVSEKVVSKIILGKCNTVQSISSKIWKIQNYLEFLTAYDGLKSLFLHYLLVKTFCQLRYCICIHMYMCMYTIYPHTKVYMNMYIFNLLLWKWRRKKKRFFFSCLKEIFHEQHTTNECVLFLL